MSERTERVDERIDRRQRDAGVFKPGLFDPLPPTDSSSSRAAAYSPADAEREELLKLLSESTIRSLDAETSRRLGYELQRTATAITAGREAEARGKEAEVRWAELCQDHALDIDPAAMRKLGHKLLKYSFTLLKAMP